MTCGECGRRLADVRNTLCRVCASTALGQDFGEEPTVRIRIPTDAELDAELRQHAGAGQ